MQKTFKAPNPKIKNPISGVERLVFLKNIINHYWRLNIL
jgi:hypothetical protein